MFVLFRGLVFGRSKTFFGLFRLRRVLRGGLVAGGGVAEGKGEGGRVMTDHDSRRRR